MHAQPSITHGTPGTFDLLIDGRRGGHLDYDLPDPETMVVLYVEVDPELRGRKFGEQLVAAAVDWARAEGRRIVPRCPFARAVMRRTPEYQDVLR